MKFRFIFCLVILGLIILTAALFSVFLLEKRFQPKSALPVKEKELPEGKWFCGSLHNHIMIFESKEQNKKSLEEVIAASKELGLKFVMLAEKGPSIGEGDKAGWAWQDMLKECDKNTSPDFVCLSGQENCTQEKAPNKPRGHFIVIENKDYLSELLEVPDLLEQAHKQGSIVIVAHPFYKEDISDMYNYNRWDILDWEAIEVIDGVIDEESNQKALKKVYELWNQGIKNSITAGADFKNHQPYTDILLSREEIKKALSSGYTCLYLNELSRGAIIEAIRNGQGYVSNGIQLKEFSINSAIMGGRVCLEKGGSLNIKIDLKAPVKINKIFLIENSQTLKKFEPNSQEFTKSVSITAEKSGWYGLEAYGEEGQRAFSNAIWVDVKGAEQNQTGKTDSAIRISYQEETPDGFPVIFQLKDSTLWVIFKSKPENQSNLFLVSSKDNGKSWSVEKPLKITNSKGNSEHTSIIEKDGVIMLAWDDGKDLKLSVSEDSGENWEQMDLGNGVYPYIYQVRDKIWYLFISRENGPGGIIKYIAFDNGKDWSEAKEILKNPVQTGKTAIFGNPVIYQFGQELWLFWDTGAEAEPVSDIWWLRSFDAGKTWAEPELLTGKTPELDDVDPCICEYNGKPILVYASRPDKNAGQDYKFYYKIYENGKWSDSKKLNQPYNYFQEHVLDWYPFCFTVKDNTSWLVWASNRLTADRSNERMEGPIQDNREIFIAPLVIEK